MANESRSICHKPLKSDTAKLELMRETMSDPLFLADLEEVTEDFKHVAIRQVFPPQCNREATFNHGTSK